jgi:hypothetical protein
MAPFPLPLTELIGKYGAYLIYLLIGFSFGYVLEISGFANSPKLAAQFYLKDMTVLKVMFTAIIVAMVLIFAASGLGLLDYNLIWVNPTYLWPGIIGGLIMGVGFIVGGFCPGTSLVAVSVFKIDGLFFALGTLFGIFLFGESVDQFATFWNSSYMGRFTLPELFGLPTGTVVILVVIMALFMFWGGEILEKIFGGRDLSKEPSRLRFGGAAAILLVALLVAFIGQPTTADRWQLIAADKAAQLEQRQVQIHPGELLSLMHDRKISLVMLDVRSEADFNLFHLSEARRVDPDQVLAKVSELHLEPANTIIVLMSNDEVAATQAWKDLVAESVPNVYILEGGINNWLALFGAADSRLQPVSFGAADQLRYKFGAALGDRYPAATPDPEQFELEFTPKVQMQNKRGPSGGGCG